MSGKTSPPASDPTNDQASNLNPRELDFINAKSFLLTDSDKTKTNVYDHLATVLKVLLAQRPPNAVDILEDISREAKRSKFTSTADTTQDKLDSSTEVALAEIQKRLFVRGDGDEEDAAPEDDAETPLPNLMQMFFFFEQAGVGLNREEVYRVWLSLKKLVDTHNLQTVRFWGKLFGVEQNYYIAEAEFREGEEEEEEESEAEEEKEEETQERDGDEDGEEEVEDATPKPDYKPPPVVPREENHSGSNKKIYFVCNEPGKAWVKLPPVTPAQIVAARKVKKFFTGRPDARVITFPPFPGSESNYLRAQIARISAGTQISPLGFYQFDEEEEEEEDSEGRDSFVENPEFDGIPVRELIDPSLSNWVHHVLHILPQGRTKWWNPVQKNEDDFEEDEEEEEREEPDEPEPEVGPPLLTPLSEDVEVEGMPPWSARLSSNLTTQYATAVVSSNLWPGAHAFAMGRTFDNVYIGWGHKYSAENYSPPPVPPVLTEFPSGPEITETDDPTPEEEDALRAAEREAQEAADDIEEAEEDEEEDD